MRKVDLRMKEEHKYEIIKKLVDSDGNKDAAALKIGCTRRHLSRLINGYILHGKRFFIHGNRGRSPACEISEEDRKTIIDLYRTKYYGANFKHFAELLGSFEKMSVLLSTINTLMAGAKILSPKARRITKKNMKISLKAQQKKTSSKKEIAKIAKAIIDVDDAHPRRPRCAYFGEMIQMDASLHIWFGNQKSQLHVGIDDATGALVGAYFDNQETLNGYYNVLYQILTNHGIPFMFYTDRRTVFEYKKKNAPPIEEDTFTQFSYACKQLGIQIKTTSIPQAKGRVERLFGTLQSRLPILLRLAGATTIELANKFLNNYLKEFNTQFSSLANHSKSVFEKQPSDETINLTLAVLAKRKIDNGHSIRCDNVFYKLIDFNGLPVYYHNKTPALVIKAFDSNFFASVCDKTYALEIIPDHELTSRNFTFDYVAVSPRKRYVPPMSHPWKHSTFDKFVGSQKHHYEQSFMDAANPESYQYKEA